MPRWMPHSREPCIAFLFFVLVLERRTIFVGVVPHYWEER